jgi:hypothetical protein
MHYEEACTSIVSRKEALDEVAAQGSDRSEFLADLGDKAEYLGGDVLEWLGY